VQKQAKLTVFDLQMEPDRTGVQFHRIDKIQGPDLLVRAVSSEVRIVVHESGASVLLAYVGHHDS
jgi:hypothetical protein